MDVGQCGHKLELGHGCKYLLFIMYNGEILINIVLIADCGYVTCEKTKEKFLRCAQSMKGPHI